MTRRMSARTWQKLPPAHAAYCQNCDWQGHQNDLDPIKDVEERTEEGDTVWAGDCPSCGAMAFTVAEVTRQQQRDGAIASAGVLLAALQRAAPWLGRMIADGGHLACVAPNDCVGALQQAEAAVVQARAAGIEPSNG